MDRNGKDSLVVSEQDLELRGTRCYRKSNGSYKSTDERPPHHSVGKVVAHFLQEEA
jgi:hypothetical protein